MQAVLISWWVILIAAFVLTVVAAFYLFKVVQTAHKLELLAKRILPAAVGIVNNTLPVKNLGTTNAVAGKILETSKAIAGVSVSMDQHVTGLVGILTKSK